MENNYIAYLLKFKNGLHLGEKAGWHEGSKNFIHSDTFFSAFVNAYRLLYGVNAVTNFLELYLKKEPPFLVTSAFPFINEILYLPMPLNQIPTTIMAKELKKIKFVGIKTFETFISNNKDIDTYEFQKNDLVDSNNNYFTIINNPRINLNRRNNSSEQYFHYGELHFNKNCGLHFLVDFKNKSFEQKFNACLNLLQEEGIGGDRTVGKGLFEYQKKDVSINFPSDSNATITLSLYFPNKTEFNNLNEGYYEIIERKGYLYSPVSKNIKRKSIRMFTEGSVLPPDIAGTLADVTPDGFDSHKVYRYGYCFSVPMKLGI